MQNLLLDYINAVLSVYHHDHMKPLGPFLTLEAQPFPAVLVRAPLLSHISSERERE